MQAQDGRQLYLCGSVMTAGQVMFDPYAAVLVSVQLQEGYNVVPPREGQNGAPYTNNPPALAGSLSVLLEDFDFGSSQRCAIHILVHLHGAHSYCLTAVHCQPYIRFHRQTSRCSSSSCPFLAVRCG